MASFRIEKILNYRKKLTFIVLLCIASQFFCVTNIAEVINAIAISTFFNHSIYKNCFFGL